MDQLTDALRDLDPPAPPSAVDLDAVVRRAHRHQARTRTFMAATVAAVLAIAVAVPVAVDRHRDAAGPPRAVCEPTGGASVATPDKDVEALARGRLRSTQVTTLTMALEGPLRQALPGATLLDASTCEPPFSFRANGHGFSVAVTVVDTAGVAHLYGWVAREAAPAGRECAGHDDVTTCLREEQQDGTVVYRARTDHGDGAVLLVLDAYRPDGVHVHLSLDNFVAAGDTLRLTRPAPPLDEVALTNLTRAEHLAP